MSADLAEYLVGSLGRLPSGVAVTALVAQDGVVESYFGGGAEPDTIYEGGSLGKTFTAFALASAVLDGQISLDTRVNDVLPDIWQLAQREATTVGELATHTSGIQRLLPGFFNLSGFWSDDPYAPYEESDAAWVLAQAKFRTPEKFRYSNLGFMILGLVVARLYDSSFVDVAQQLVIGPAGLSRATYQPGEVGDNNLAAPHNARGATVKPWTFSPFVQGAAVPRISPADAIAWLQFVKTTDAGRLCLQPHANRGRNGQIGLAWMLSNNSRIAAHTGGTGGTRCLIATNLHAERSLCIFVGQAVPFLKFRRMQRRALRMLGEEWTN